MWHPQIFGMAQPWRWRLDRPYLSMVAPSPGGGALGAIESAFETALLPCSPESVAMQANSSPTPHYERNCEHASSERTLSEPSRSFAYQKFFLSGNVLFNLHNRQITQNQARHSKANPATQPPTPICSLHNSRSAPRTHPAWPSPPPHPRLLSPLPRTARPHPRRGGAPPSSPRPQGRPRPRPRRPRSRQSRRPTSRRRCLPRYRERSFPSLTLRCRLRSRLRSRERYRLHFRRHR
mmetsp:Transcript_4531/g.11082  ORF Transcript_4531/g.11082 Transcript_4531/m.11082 type:complete len:236 (-) Transcript_4531:167-874(-)